MAHCVNLNAFPLHNTSIQVHSDSVSFFFPSIFYTPLSTPASPFHPLSPLAASLPLTVLSNCRSAARALHRTTSTCQAHAQVPHPPPSAPLHTPPPPPFALRLCLPLLCRTYRQTLLLYSPLLLSLSPLFDALITGPAFRPLATPPLQTQRYGWSIKTIIS